MSTKPGQSQDDIKRISDAFLNGVQSEQSKIFPSRAFGYWKITIEQPLRLQVNLSSNVVRRFRKACADGGEAPLVDLIESVATKLGEGPHNDFNKFLETVEAVAGSEGIRLTAKRVKFLSVELGSKDPKAAPVIRKIAKGGADANAERDALFGRHYRTSDGKTAIIEYEPDPDLRDTELVPFLEPGGIEAFFCREVLPHAPDAWIDLSKTVIGFEISFPRHFYKPQPLRTLGEIEADIRALEIETEGLLEDVLAAGD